MGRDESGTLIGHLAKTIMNEPIGIHLGWMFAAFRARRRRTETL